MYSFKLGSQSGLFDKNFLVLSHIAAPLLFWNLPLCEGVSSDGPQDKNTGLTCQFLQKWQPGTPLRSQEASAVELMHCLVGHVWSLRNKEESSIACLVDS